MKKRRFTEFQIITMLKEYESSKKVSDIAREHRISTATFFYWKSKYGGLEVNELKRLRELEEENSRLKKTYADVNFTNLILKDVITKRLVHCKQRNS
ncbi:MAG: transposase [Bacteroidetes bacterium]|nr:transposase [Bacteroidota bacterium]